MFEGLCELNEYAFLRYCLLNYLLCGNVEFSFCLIDREEEEMNKREDRREGNKHCKERSSKDKVINIFLNFI